MFPGVTVCIVANQGGTAGVPLVPLMGEGVFNIRAGSPLALAMGYKAHAILNNACTRFKNVFQWRV